VNGQLALWAHAVAALLFAAAALAQWRRPRDGWPGSAFLTALVLSALWALAQAGIGPRDLGTRVVEAARDLAWLAFSFALVRRARAGAWTLAAVYLVVAGVVGINAALAAAEATAPVLSVRGELATARTVFGMMAAAGALVLAKHLHGAAPHRGGVRAIATALALIWGGDLLLLTATYFRPDIAGATSAARGTLSIAAAVLLLVAAQRREAWALALSRPAATRALIAVALIVYLGMVTGASTLAASWGGEHGRALQAGVVVGAAVALLTLLSTSWLGAWAKVKLAKHLFAHRYDYRIEWQRFTDTLGTQGEPLEARVVAATARLLDAPAGLLLLADGDVLSPAGAWRWDIDGVGSATLATHLTATRRIVEIDAARAGLAADDAAALPAWVLDRSDAWVLVPLIHGEALVGAVLLARPPVPRALDWEDFDLLRVAGRQAASYLAEDRAGRALAEARRFDEFNRRFAFMLHDIKNLVSQQLLVARNAERHAANPQFRADMVATLKESADRMTALLARLSQREPGPAEPLQRVDLAATIERVARSRRAQHPIHCLGVPAHAIAHPQRLEQVLGHLLQNAIEASPPDAPVTLTVATDGEQVALTVADAGPGMSAGFIRDELFRPFASTKPTGFGIGAFEARQLVAGMGGTLQVESHPGEGTRFRILLPVAAAMEQAA
jgi:putative PEP-CTERM system histidine kinase